MEQTKKNWLLLSSISAAPIRLADPGGQGENSISSRRKKKKSVIVCAPVKAFLVWRRNSRSQPTLGPLGFFLRFTCLFRLLPSWMLTVSLIFSVSIARYSNLYDWLTRNVFAWAVCEIWIGSIPSTIECNPQHFFINVKNQRVLF